MSYNNNIPIVHRTINVYGSGKSGSETFISGVGYYQSIPPAQVYPPRSIIADRYTPNAPNNYVISNGHTTPSIYPPITSPRQIVVYPGRSLFILQ